MLHLRLQRKEFYTDRTIGRLSAYDEGGYSADLCYTLEPFCNHTYNCQPVAEIKAAKVDGQTAIPFGAYYVRFQYSPKFKRQMLTIFSVPAFDGIRMHAGNYPKDTNGCPLLGLEVSSDMLLGSKKALELVEYVVSTKGSGEALLLVC